ncbi:putative arabinosyltransferase C [Corynebacterium urogenitale]|uniref:Putative arabinosyltransferase C n=2 Tax=Corynebacterium urogenitale TaxID=2487892 RepID=A0A5J6Z7G3_9CORY|nr:putative arabinosyltransferase C [Corynebacterium urogenitale]
MEPEKQAKKRGSAPKKKSASRLKALAIITGVMGFILFCLTPILPVKQTHAEFSWPQGDDLTSVTAPLISYTPQDIDMTLPVKEIQKLNPGETTALSTVPEDSAQATLRGLFVRSTDRTVDVVIRNVVPLSIDKDTLRQLPDDAVLRITSTFESTRVWVPDATNANGEPLDSTINDDIRPMVTGIYSEIANTPETFQSAKDAGVEAKVTVDSRFTSTPTILKTLAMILGVIMTVISLWTLHRIDSLDGRKSNRILPARWWKLRPIDSVVGVFLLGWYFIGANTADDGYILSMARLADASGYMANYYRWHGVPESPFGFPFYDLLALMTKVSTASIWIRLPGLIAGIITWLILSREVLPRLGTKINQRKVAHWTMAAAFLAFWMTYNNGARPEPIIAMTSLLAWVSFERAIATHRLLPAAIGTIIATLALGAGPTGLMAVAALLVSLGAIVRIAIRRLPLLGAEKGSSKGAVFTGMFAQIAPFLAAGTAILIGVFGDQTLRSVLEAISVRGAIGPSVAWYDEYIRYTSLLEQSIDGSFTRRFIVMMMFFSFGVVIASMLRNGRVPGATKGPSTRLVLVIIGTMFFMTFTPTKWTHHFGVYAGVGAALMGLAAVAASHISLSSRRNRVLFIGATLMLFSFTLAGTNGWWYIGSFGVPWWDKPIQLAGIEASTVMLGISLLVLVWGVLVGYLTEFKTARAETKSERREIDAEERRRTLRFQGIAAAPIGVLTALVVVFSMLSLGKGFISQWPAYSIGKGNLVSLTGNTCNMASDVLVETNTNDSFLAVAGGGELKDSLVNDDSRGFEPNNIPTRIDPGVDNTSSSSMPQTSVRADGAGASGSSDSTSRSSTGSNGDSTTNDSSDASTTGSQGEDVASDQNQETTDEDANESGTQGGVASDRGINGSYAKLPFFLDNQQVPVVGSFREGLQVPARTITDWYEIPEMGEDQPLIVFSAAGKVAHDDMNGVFQYGQELKVEFGRGEGDNYEMIGEYQPLDIGTGPEWRNMRVPKDAIPEGANVIRIRAIDTNLTPDQWLAITPPRAPQMVSMNDYIPAEIGDDAPGLLDWSVAFQFPCQRNYDHYAGVAEVAEYRISPDHGGRRVHSGVMDYLGGGSVGLTEMTSQSTELPTYLKGDWQRDWGVFDRLETVPNARGERPKPAELTETSTTELGTYYPGPMKYMAE